MDSLIHVLKQFCTGKTGQLIIAEKNEKTVVNANTLTQTRYTWRSPSMTPRFSRSPLQVRHELCLPYTRKSFPQTSQSYSLSPKYTIYMRRLRSPHQQRSPSTQADVVRRNRHLIEHIIINSRVKIFQIGHTDFPSWARIFARFQGRVSNLTKSSPLRGKVSGNVSNTL